MINWSLPDSSLTPVSLGRSWIGLRCHHGSGPVPADEEDKVTVRQLRGAGSTPAMGKGGHRGAAAAQEEGLLASNGGGVNGRQETSAEPGV